MHYIRFLKLPRLLPGSPPTLTAKITVTTDLGESFLCVDVLLTAEVWLEDGTAPWLERECQWKGNNGMRALSIDIPLPADHRSISVYMIIRAPNHQVDTLITALGGAGDEGGIVAVRSMNVEMGSRKSAENNETPLAARQFTAGAKSITIWEETGESIARHIWDAGLLLSSYIAALSVSTANEDKGYVLNKNIPLLHLLDNTLKEESLNVLEVGAGCGIVGVTLSTYFPNARLLLTDLPEATEIINKNITQLDSSTSSCLPTHTILDWSQPLDLSIISTDWNLIVVADCTYNPDVVPDLISTLKSLTNDRDTPILLAMKVRHDSELAFFDQMEDSGFVIIENMQLPLPMLGGEAEEIEVFVFGGVHTLMKWKK